jgi:hypothetical protein
MNLDRWMISTRILRAAENEGGAPAPAAPAAEAPAAAAPAASEAPASPASPLSSADSSKRDGAPAPESSSASTDAPKTPEKSGDAPPPGGADGKPPAEADGAKKPEAGAEEGKKPDAAKPEEGKAEGAEAAADKPKEGEGEAKAKEGEAPPPPKPTYEPYKLPENLKLDDKRVEAFNEILGEAELSGKADHAVMQQIGQKLMDMYADEVQRVANDFRKYQVDVWNRHLESEVGKLKADTQYGGNRIDTSLGNAKYILEQFGGTKDEQARFMEKLDRSGISSSVEFVALLNRMHERYREPQPVQPNLPSQKTNTGPGARGWYDTVDVGKA